MGALGMFLGNHTVLSRRIHLVQGRFDQELRGTRQVILAPFRRSLRLFMTNIPARIESRAGRQRFYLSVVWKLLHFHQISSF
jgi:hypothetical protein